MIKFVGFSKFSLLGYLKGWKSFRLELDRNFIERKVDGQGQLSDVKQGHLIMPRIPRLSNNLNYGETFSCKFFWKPMWGMNMHKCVGVKAKYLH